MFLHLTIRAVFTRWRLLKGGKYFIFMKMLLSRKRAFTQNISGTVTDQVKFHRYCFWFRVLSQKSSSWFPSWTVKYISQECHDFNFSYLHIEPESDFIFKNIFSLANLNSPTKFVFIFQLLHIKVLAKGISEKQYFNNIVSIKSLFLANWVMWKM